MTTTTCIKRACWLAGRAPCCSVLAGPPAPGSPPRPRPSTASPAPPSASRPRPATSAPPTGNSVYFWGYANGAGNRAVPRPDPDRQPGRDGHRHPEQRTARSRSRSCSRARTSRASGGQPGRRADPRKPPRAGGTVTYTFTASRAGHVPLPQRDRPDLQIEMGLVGALIVRPTGSGTCRVSPNRKAYAPLPTALTTTSTCSPDRDGRKSSTTWSRHRAGCSLEVDTDQRASPSTGSSTAAPAPTPCCRPTPLGCRPSPTTPCRLLHAGDKVLMRVIGAGRDSHPFHHHGNNALSHRPRRPAPSADRLRERAPTSATRSSPSRRTPGRPRRPLHLDRREAGLGRLRPCARGSSGPRRIRAGPRQAVPGQAADGSGLDLRPDVLGQSVPGCAGHPASRPGRLQPGAGFMYMWHSHNEKEICNNNIFAGGMLTFLLIAAHPTTP